VPSTEHEIPLELIRHRPDLVRILCRAAGVELPAGTVETIATDLTELTSGPHFADCAIEIRDGGETTWAVVVEVQRDRDDNKPYAWPAYVARLRAQLERPVTLLVFATSPSVARWARQPIELGHPGFVLRPIVVDYEMVPRVTDPDDGRKNPELAVLSALSHPGDDEVGRAALDAISGLRDDHGKLYWDIVATAHAAIVRKFLEESMKGYEYQSEFARHFIAQGREEGRVEGCEEGLVKAVLRVVRARLGTLSTADEQRIRAMRGTAVEQLCTAVASVRDEAHLREILASFEAV
jgi:hypothetical protein